MIFEELQIRSAFSLKPQINVLENFQTAKIKRVNTDTRNYEDLDRLHDKLKKALREIPRGRYKQVTFGKSSFLKYPQVSNPLKNEFLRKMESYINKVWNVRKRTSYFLYEEGINEDMLYGSFPQIEKVENKEFLSDLAYFFGGDEAHPFGKTLEEWEYGFKVGDKYVIVLIQYQVGDKVIKFSMDFLNTIDVDFIHVLHFEPLDSLQAENKVNMALSIAKKTGMPKDMINELEELRKQAILKRADLVKFCNVLFLFCDSEEEAIKKAYEVKSKVPYNVAFEGNIEFEMPFILSDWDFLKGKDMAGIVRYSTTDYLASLIYITGRYTGKPEGYFIPMLNEALEPAYIPINRDLFNIGLTGQMGSGKSVTLQYLATMFDMTVFIEKIQSDVGSYAVYCKYFDGDYVPVSLDVPVSINPLDKPYTYFTVNVFDLAKQLGIERPHEYFDQNEIGAISLLLDDYVLKKKSLTKEELIDVLKQDKRAVRMLKAVEGSDLKEWKVSVDVNSSKKTFILTFLSFVYKGDDEHVEGFSEVKSYIERLIDDFYRERFEENPYQELLISDLYRFIEDKGHEGRIKERLLARLYSFKDGGKYGHLFDAPTSIREDVEHVFFEVRFNEKDIIPIVMMTIMDYVNKVYGSVKYKDRTKLVVIDEGWFFMNIPMARDFIDEAFRTYRKRGISIGFGTQNPRDYESMLNYLPYVWILYLENPEEAVEVFKLTDRDYELLKSIDKPKAYKYRYSKAFLIFKNEEGKTEKGLFILPSYPEFRWIAETDPVFKLKREEAVLKYEDLRKAIEKLAFESI